MARLFLSYRRSDSAGHAGRLLDRLEQAFGKDEVFMDVGEGGIAPGADFTRVLTQQLQQCEVMLVVIGPTWLNCTVGDTDQRRRLDDPEDWVRIEVAEALARDIPVIPVLVGGAARPAAPDLPAPLQLLAKRQETVLDDRRWNASVDDLVRRLKALPSRKDTDHVERWARRIGVRRTIAAAVLLFSALGAGLWAWLGPGAITVPSLTGIALADARQRVASAGLALPADAVSEEERLDRPAGQVLRQEPAAGLQVSRGQPVRLVVARTAPAVDLSDRVQIRDVGQEGTIAATAAVMAIEASQPASAPPVRLSERYLYEKAKRHDETTGMGTWMTAIVYVAEQFGVAPLANWPYRADEHTPPRGTTWAALDAAAQAHKARFLRVASVEEIYPALRQGRPVVATVKVTPEWDTEAAMKTGRVAVDQEPVAGSNLVGTMAIVIVGFDPASQDFTFAHSWGTAWGRRGFGQLSIASARRALDLNGTWAVAAEPGRP